MTATEKQICRLTARALRIMSVQDDAEADGDDETARCLDDALGRLAMEAQRITASVAEPAGHDMADVNRVVAALIPAETDEEMTITRTRSAWLIAHAETLRAEAALEDAATERETDGSETVVARYIFSMKQYGDALLMMAETETDVHLAAMTPDEAEDLERSLESLEILEG